MRRFYLSTIIAFLAMGLYGQEKDTAQVEPQIKLELVWEKEIPAGIDEIVFLDENGYNVFSSQCKNPEKAIKEMKMLLIGEEKVKLVSGDDYKVVKEIDFLPHSRVAISKNGRNIAVIEHIISDTIPEAKLRWDLAVIKTTLRLFNGKLEELARIDDYAGPYTEVFAIGNDKTVILVDAGEDGSYTTIIVLTREGNTFKRSFGVGAGTYPTGLFDYAEDGSLIFAIYNDERIVLDGQGRELARYKYKHQGYRGWVSPKGNYLLECLGGGNLVIRKKEGSIIAEKQGYGGRYIGFSPDEKYFCLTPGSWRVYFFETETGKMLWEYVDNDENTNFSSVAVLPFLNMVFVGRSEAILKPGEFKGTVDELNKKVIENATKDRSVYVIKDGELLQRLESFHGVGFGTQLQTPDLRVSNDGKFLLVKVPRKIFIYSIFTGGER